MNNAHTHGLTVKRTNSKYNLKIILIYPWVRAAVRRQHDPRRQQNVHSLAYLLSYPNRQHKKTQVPKCPYIGEAKLPETIG